MATTPKPPRIDPGHVGDDTSLGATIDALLQGDPRMRRHVHEIIPRQRELQRAASEEAWEAFLDLEVAVNSRYADALVRVARWAWSAGREHERQRRGS